MVIIACCLYIVQGAGCDGGVCSLVKLPGVVQLQSAGGAQPAPGRAEISEEMSRCD